VGGVSLKYPGDPGGPPRETINCRCTVLPVMEGVGAAAGDYRTIEGGQWQFDKTGARQWQLDNGVEVEGYTLSDDRWDAGAGRHTIGEIKHSRGKTRIMVDEYYDGGRRVKLSAADRDRIIEEVIGPWLQDINPEHLDKLDRVMFSNIENARANGVHKVWGDEFGWIEINHWQGYMEHDNLAGMATTLRHELGHHVWDFQLTDEDRMAYARALSIVVDNPAALDFKREQWDLLKPIFETAINDDSISLTGGFSGYCDTNIFEDFAEFYNGFNALSQEMEPGRHGDSFLDDFIEYGKFQQGAFDLRMGAINLAKLLLGR